jgi:hypothetical protein
LASDSPFGDGLVAYGDVLLVWSDGSIHVYSIAEHRAVPLFHWMYRPGSRITTAVNARTKRVVFRDDESVYWFTFDDRTTRFQKGEWASAPLSSFSALPSSSLVSTSTKLATQMEDE